LERVIALKLQNFSVALEVSGKFNGGVTWPYGAVIRNADIQKWSVSLFCLAVDLVLGLSEAAVNASSLLHVLFRDNSVIIF
jgi:hypothetical protein